MSDLSISTEAESWEEFEYEGCEEGEEFENETADLFPETSTSSIDLGVYDIRTSRDKYDSKSPSNSSHFFESPYKIRCLGELQLSRSSQLLNPFRFLEDLIIDVDLTEHLWAPKIYPTYDDIGVERYKDLAKEYSAPIIKDIINQLETDTMKLKYYGLKKKSLKILLEVLRYNKYVKHLDLTNNVIGSIDVAKVFAEMIKENDTIETINLTYCNIGPENLVSICQHISTNKHLKEFNLSHCNIEDKGCIALAEELAQNTAVKKLDLSFNNLTSNCCQDLGDCIFDNNDLMELNLSGNTFKEPGFAILVANIRDNFTQSIARLNLSKCNLGLEHDKSLKILTLKAPGLKYLDLSFNQICGTTVECIAFGMRRNSNLLELSLGYNPLTTDDIILLMDTLKVMRPARKLKVLDLSDKYVPKQCSDILEKIKNKRQVIYRGLLADYTIQGPDQKSMFITRLKTLCEPKSKKNKNGNKFGAFFHNIKVDYIKPSEFSGFLEEVCQCDKLIKDKDFLRGLATVFTDQTKKVNVGLLRDMFLTAYPETPKPPPPPEEKPQAEKTKKKGKGKAKGKAEKK